VNTLGAIPFGCDTFSETTIMSALREFVAYVKNQNPTAAAAAPGAVVPGAAAPAPAAVAPAPAAPADLDPSKWIPVDLAPLRADLNATATLVLQAQLAAKSMRDTAASAKIDLHNPKAAAAGLKNTLTDQDKINLTGKLGHVKDSLNIMVMALHQVQSTRDELNAAIAARRNLPKALPAEFFDDLHKKIDDAVGGIERVVDFANQVTAAMSVVTIIHALVGADQVKDLIKYLFDDDDDTNKKMTQIAEKINELIKSQAQGQDAAINAWHAALMRDRGDYTNTRKTYSEALEEYNRYVAELVARPHNGIPPQFAKVYQAVANAALASKRTRAKLDAGMLSTTRYQATLDSVANPGNLVLDGHESDEPTGGRMMGISDDLLVYEKGGKQYVYRETMQTMHVLVQEIEGVKQIFETGKELDPLYDNWNAVLSK
jgi:hypothetical protein